MSFRKMLNLAVPVPASSSISRNLKYVPTLLLSMDFNGCLNYHSFTVGGLGYEVTVSNTTRQAWG